MVYTVFDNNSGKHFIDAVNDSAALLYMQSHYLDYIYSLLSCDSIVLCRPNGYILAYINSATGEQTVKSMSDWVPEFDFDCCGGVYV